MLEKLWQEREKTGKASLRGTNFLFEELEHFEVRKYPTPFPKIHYKRL